MGCCEQSCFWQSKTQSLRNFNQSMSQTYDVPLWLWHTKSVVDECLSAQFLRCFIPLTLVVSHWWHFGLLSMLNCCWTVSERDHSDWFLAEPVHNKQQSQGSVEMALLILHLNLTWAFQYANIFIATSGVKKVKMVLKHFFVYRMCIHIPSFAFPNDKYRLLPPAGIGIIPLT